MDPGSLVFTTILFNFSIQQFQKSENNWIGKEAAANYNWDPKYRVSFEGTSEGAAIVTAMYYHTKYPSGEYPKEINPSSQDMAVIWAAYRSGIKDYIPRDDGQGFASVDDFRNNIANGGSGDYQMGKNAYMSEPYFQYYQELFSQKEAYTDTRAAGEVSGGGGGAGW